ncbi:MAG: AAA family ATPase [Pseudomonadota bacterium]
MIEELAITGYRSIRQLRLELAPLTVVIGPNGVGKTNLYRGLDLIHAAARGTLARTLAAEGGMPSVLWAGDGWRTDAERETAARARRKGAARLELSVRVDHLSYALKIGMPNRVSDAALDNDPCVREESVTAHAGRRKVAMMSRKGPALIARTGSGTMRPVLGDLLLSETALSSVTEPEAFPELLMLQRAISGWRFHHQFRADPASPLRQPQYAICAPELDSDGGNWAAALMTSAELGDPFPVDTAVDAAFPGARLVFAENRGRAEPQLLTREFHRPFGPAELSDGMLRYLCLIAALTAYRLPTFMALNEPETSLHPDMIAPLADLIGRSAGRAQILVVTHSQALAERLDLDYAALIVRLVKTRGETCIEEI